MSTFKKGKVVMLPTNERVINTKEYQLLLSNSLFWTSKIEIERYDEGWFFLNNSSNPNSCAITVPNVENLKHQHLYIISDDEIKENNTHFYNPHSGQLHISGNHTDYIAINKNGCKKIIATTDTSLLIDTYINQGDTVKGDLIIKRGSDYTTGLKGRINLPQPSQQFIKKFVEEYNKGNIIEDVLVEYEEGKSYSGNEGLIIKEWLKINPKDNTITIKKVKDSWTREEILDDIEQSMIQGLNIGQYRDKWI